MGSCFARGRALTAGRVWLAEGWGCTLKRACPSFSPAFTPFFKRWKEERGTGTMGSRGCVLIH